MTTRESLNKVLRSRLVAGAGYAAIGYANAALQAALLAMQRVLGHLHRAGSIAGIEDQLMMFAERQRALDAEAFKTLEKRYAAPG